MTRSPLPLLAIGIMVATASVTAANAQPAPDRILVNGKVLTVDADFSIAQAIAISGERILAVGTNDSVRGLAGPDTVITDLRGRTVIPGLIDNAPTRWLIWPAARHSARRISPGRRCHR